MGDENNSEQRRFVRLDLTEDVRALDEQGQEIGRVEKVGAGGMQIRMSDGSRQQEFRRGARMQIKVVEPGNVQQEFHVEIRVCDGNLLGVQFLS